MRGRDIVVFASCLVALAAPFAFAEVIEIVFWHHEAPAYRVAAFQKVIDAFHREYPTIRVRQEVVPWGEAWSRTAAAIRAGTTPDFQFDIPELNVYAFELGGIIPVTQLVERIHSNYGFIWSQVTPYEYEGEIWGVPIWTMPMVLIYRPSMFEAAGILAPPRTWEELLEVAEKLTNPPDVYGIMLTAGLNLLTQELAWCFMAPSGTQLFDERGHVTFNSPETVRAVAFYRELFRFSPPGSAAWIWGEAELNFGADRIAMMPYFGGLQKRFLEDLGSTDIAAAPMPMPGEKGYARTLTYPNAVHVFRSAARDPKRLEAVFTFIEFMLRPDMNTIITAGQEPGSFVPVTEAMLAFDSPYWDHPTIKAFLEMNRLLVREVRYGTLYGFEHGVVNFGIGEIIGENVIAEVIQRVIIGGESPETAVAWGQRRMEELSRPVR
ncbi:MAG: sugar ABC transporter substrate-binding protein [Thermofilaceae archaeon]